MYIHIGIQIYFVLKIVLIIIKVIFVYFCANMFLLYLNFGKMVKRVTDLMNQHNIIRQKNKLIEVGCIIIYHPAHT